MMFQISAGPAQCALLQRPPPKCRAELKPIKPGYPMQIVAVDILGPLPESDARNSYLLVVGEYFTRWMEAFPIPNQEAVTVARTLVDKYFCRFGLYQNNFTLIRANNLSLTC